MLFTVNAHWLLGPKGLPTALAWNNFLIPVLRLSASSDLCRSEPDCMLGFAWMTSEMLCLFPAFESCPQGAPRVSSPHVRRAATPIHSVFLWETCTLVWSTCLRYEELTSISLLAVTQTWLSVSQKSQIALLQGILGKMVSKSPV